MLNLCILTGKKYHLDFLTQQLKMNKNRHGKKDKTKRQTTVEKTQKRNLKISNTIPTWIQGLNIHYLAFLLYIFFFSIYHLNLLCSNVPDENWISIFKTLALRTDIAVRLIEMKTTFVSIYLIFNLT